jgi:hypothetical protein
VAFAKTGKKKRKGATVLQESMRYATACLLHQKVLLQVAGGAQGDDFGRWDAAI